VRAARRALRRSFAPPAEDVSLALEEQSEAALRRLPRAAAEVAHAGAEAASLGGAVAAVLARLEAAEAASSASVGPLASLERARARLERARGTLSEAAGLAELLEQSGSLLAGGDVRALSAALQQMRRSLSVVGAAPEFAAGAARVAALEEALERQIAPGLTAALAQRDAAAAAELAQLLAGCGREGALERLYTAARLPALLAGWEARCGGEGGGEAAPQLAAALPAWYEDVAAAAAAEARWVEASLPAACAPRLPLALLSELAARTAKPLSARLTAALGAPGGAAPPQPLAPTELLDTLQPLWAAAAGLARQLASRAFPAAPPPALRPLLEAFTRPFEPWLAAYGEAERRHLTAELGALNLRDGGGLAAAAARMADSVPQAQRIVAAAAARCAALTGGVEAEALLRAADDALLSYLTSLQALLRRQRAALALPGAAEAPPDAAPPSDEALHAVVALLAVARQLLSRSAQLEGQLRAALAEAAGRLRHALPGGGGEAALCAAGDAAGLRLLAAPERARRLHALLLASAEPRFGCLQHAAPRCAALADAMGDLVRDALGARLAAGAAELAALPLWAEREGRSEPGFELPAFSASPSEPATAMGEYLLTLPQLLEAVEGGEEAEEGGAGAGAAAAWLQRLALGGAEALVGALTGLRALTTRGASQAEADADYFCNVLAALEVPPPPALLTLRALAPRAAEGLAAAAAAAAAEGVPVDAAVLEALQRMRAAAAQPPPPAAGAA